MGATALLPTVLDGLWNCSKQRSHMTENSTPRLRSHNVAALAQPAAKSSSLQPTAVEERSRVRVVNVIRTDVNCFRMLLPNVGVVSVKCFGLAAAKSTRDRTYVCSQAATAVTMTILTAACDY